MSTTRQLYTVRDFRALALLAAATLILFSAAAGCTSSSNNPPAQPAVTVNSVDSDKDGIPDAAEQVLGTDPLSADTDGDGVADAADKAPTTVDVQPQPSSGAGALKIADILVENNYDSVAKKDAPDHLELQLENTSNKDINDIVVYYVITDASNGQSESYLQPLTGLVLKPGDTQTVHFDQATGVNHFRANPNGMYYRSADELRFTVTVSAPGFQAQGVQAKKDAGGAEVPD
jgi:hypothetical protein